MTFLKVILILIGITIQTDFFLSAHEIISPIRKLTNFNGIINFSVGDTHVCAVDMTRDLYCWGKNDKGQLGYEDSNDRTEIELLDSVNIGTNRIMKSIHVAASQTCVILDSNDLICWGENAKGTLGLGHTDNIGDDLNSMGDNLQITNLGAGRKLKKLALRNLHACAILDNDKLKCWGYDDKGQLGYEETENRGDDAGEMGDDLPYVGSNLTVKDVQLGEKHTCVLLFSNEIKCWGLGSNGRLGYGNEDDQIYSDSLPAVDVGAGTISNIFAGTHLSCALFDTGNIKCWGKNGSGELGYGDTFDRGVETTEMGNNLPFIDLGSGETVKDLSAGLENMCAVLNSNKVKCWGKNFCQLGYGDSIGRGTEPNEMGDNLPFIDFGSRDAKEIKSPFKTSCVKFLDDTISCFGDNGEGQLGLGHTNDIGCNAGEMGDNLLVLQVSNAGYSFSPSSVPSENPSGNPSTSLLPSGVPSTSLIPSISPTDTIKPSKLPSNSYYPSNFPSTSSAPTTLPVPSNIPSKSLHPSRIASNIPSLLPSQQLSLFPTTAPSEFECLDNVLSLQITTDINPYYTHWFLRDKSTNTMSLQVWNGYYTKKNTVYNHNYCFHEGLFEFNFEHDLAEWFGEFRLSINEQVIDEAKPDGYFHQEKRIISYCTNDSECNDNDICTKDSCDTNTNECTFIPEFSEDCRSSGNAETLIIRVTSLDSYTTATSEELHESFFGNADYTLKSQISQCSYDVMKINPFSGSTTTNEIISNGVVEIEVNINIIGESASLVSDEILAAANNKLGNLSSQFDFVIVCVPPGTSISTTSNWVAYAFVNSYISIYNDNNCLYPSVQMHEIGHNIGLSHSNDVQKYGDLSGMMGLSTLRTDGPMKCFNAPKSFKLGWYWEGIMVMDIESILMTEAKLVGVSDYLQRGFKSVQMKIINCQNGYDYYVSFNRNTKMNSGTEEGQNQVLVTRRSVGVYYDDSTLIGKLGHLQKFTIYNLGPKGDWNLQIIPNIHLHTDPSYARISFLKWNSFCSTSNSCDDKNRCTIDSCIDDADNYGCANTPVADCDDCGSLIQLEVITNDSPELLSWELLNYDTQRIVKSSISYTKRETPFSFSDCFQYGRYKFFIYYADNSTASNLSSSFHLKVGDLVIDEGIISELIFSEIIFSICETNEDCVDHDGCTIDFCNQETKLCNNKILQSQEECNSCSWISVDIMTDRFGDETEWYIENFETNSRIVSGDPYPLYVLAGRSKAPTKAGRSKAPTRAIAHLKPLDEGNTVSENYCLENNIQYHFVITDSFGDGICCAQGQGSYVISKGSNVIQEGGDFASREEVIFKFSDSEVNCDDNDAGTNVTYDKGDSICYYSYIPCDEYGALVTVEIKSDIYADDTSWNIVSGNITIIDGDRYDLAFTLFEKSKCVPFGSYTFSVFDSQENGMAFCFDNDCGYKLKVNNETVITSDGSFGSIKSYLFGVCINDDHCNDNDECTSDTCNVEKKICIFEQNCSLCNKIPLTVNVKTDELFSLTSWKILDSDSQMEHQRGGPFVTSYRNYNETFCFPSGNYIFAMMNNEGRGMTLCDTGDCGYNVFVEGHPLIQNDGSFSYEQKNIFGICSHDIECNDSDECTIDTCNQISNTCIYEKLPCSKCNKNNVTICLITDFYPEETSISLSSITNNVTQIQYGPFANKHGLYHQSYCIDNGSYIFEVHDSVGDGLSACKTTPQNCGYSLIVNNKTIFESDGSFLYNESQILIFCSNNEDCNDNDDCTIDYCDIKSKTCIFDMHCWECSKNIVTIDTVTDEDGGNTAWYITQNGTVLSTGGVFAKKKYQYLNQMCLSFGEFNFELLHRGSSNLAGSDPHFTLAMNGMEAVRSKYLQSKNYTFGRNIEDWYIDFVTIEFVNKNQLTLKYFTSKNLTNAQFMSRVYDKTCTDPMNHQSIIISNSSLIFQNEEIIDKGITYLDLDFSLVKETIFWNQVNEESAYVNLCVKSELLLREDSNISVSFVDTKIDILVSMESTMIISNAELLPIERKQINHEQEIEVSACVCDDTLSCHKNPTIFPNSEVSFCIMVLNNDNMAVKEIKSMEFYQDGILKYSPIKNGKYTPITNIFVSGDIGVVQTRLLSFFFVDTNPSKIYVSGVISLGWNRNRHLFQKTTERTQIQTKETLESFHFMVSVLKPKYFTRNGYLRVEFYTIFIIFALFTYFVIKRKSFHY